MHFAVAPQAQLEETCLQCYSKRSEEQARYAIDFINAHIREKMRKAEFWLSCLIDKIVEGKKNNVAPEIVRQAQDRYLKAHILRNYWTAEKTAGK